MSTLYTAITNHGFGHATRTASVLADLQQRSPDLKLIIATTAPRWLLKEYIEGDFIYHPRVFDVGVIQIDSLQVDREATFEAWQKIRDQQADLIASEVKFLQENQVDLIFGDIPPMVAEIAKAAKIPCWMAGNFGWDFIYRDWGREFTAIADWISDCYGQCDRLFRVPLHESMSRFPAIEDVGLTGGDPKYSLDVLREKFNLIQPKERTILLTFGGLSLDAIPYQNIDRFPNHQFITLDRQAPELPNLVKALDLAVRPVDFMPLCDRVVSKPGYSTYAEALKLQIPIVSLTRSGFAEAEIILTGMQDYGYHQIINPDDFFGSDWDFLNSPLQPPRLTAKIKTDGNLTIASSIVAYFKDK